MIIIIGLFLINKRKEFARSVRNTRKRPTGIKPFVQQIETTIRPTRSPQTSSELYKSIIKNANETENRTLSNVIDGLNKLKELEPSKNKSIDANINTLTGYKQTNFECRYLKNLNNSMRELDTSIAECS